MLEKVSRTGQRRGRAARLDARKEKPTVTRSTARRKIPVTEIFGESELDQLEQQADWILKEVGIEFRGDPEVLDLFREAGATVNGERVRFDSGHAKALCATAPSSFVMHGRDPQHSITVGDDSVSCTPGYGSPFVTDMDQGRRYATLKDFENFGKAIWNASFKIYMAFKNFVTGVVTAIKDVIDLCLELSNRSEGRKLAAELNAIQRLILSIQSDQAALHEENSELREERLSLKERIQELESELTLLKNNAERPDLKFDGKFYWAQNEGRGGNPQTVPVLRGTIKSGGGRFFDPVMTSAFSFGNGVIQSALETC